MRMSLSLRPAKRPVRRGSLPAFLLSILLVSRVPAEDDGLLRIVLDHLPVDCEDRQRGWGCDDEAHHSFVVDGKAIPDRKALDVALRTAAGGDGKSEGSGRRVWVRAEDRVPYTIVWGLLESCSRAGLHRFVWTAAAAGGEKSPVERTASGRPPREVWIRIEFHIRAMMTQIDDGSWISEDREILEALRAARVDGQTTAVLDPEGGIPWSEIARRIDLCARSGIEEVEFLGFQALPPGYSNQVTEGEATALAQALDQAAAEDQAALLDHLVDRHEMFRRMVGTIPLSVAVRHRTASVFVPGILSGRTLPRIQGGSRMLRFLGMNPTAPGVSRPLFRIRTDTGLDYVELVLARRPDGQIRIVDVFSLRRGGLQSEDGRTTLLPSPPVLKILNDMAAPTPEDFLMEEHPAFMELFELFKRNAHRELDGRAAR
jgi:hypothetical protein